MTAHELKTRRKKATLTQYGLAKYSRVPVWSIKAFEVGYRALTEDEALNITNALTRKEASLAANKKSKSK
jgi:hypothetical protein